MNQGGKIIEVLLDDDVASEPGLAFVCSLSGVDVVVYVFEIITMAGLGSSFSSRSISETEKQTERFARIRK